MMGTPSIQITNKKGVVLCYSLFRYYMKGCVCMPFKEINVKSAIEEHREKDTDFKAAWDSSQKEYANQLLEIKICSPEDSLMPKS